MVLVFRDFHCDLIGPPGLHFSKVSKKGECPLVGTRGNREEKSDTCLSFHHNGRDS